MTKSQQKIQMGQSELSPDYSGDEGAHLEDGTEMGSVQIHNSVIAMIARLAALKVPGVVDMSGGIVDGLAGMIGKKNMDRGIRVDVQENAVTVELHVTLEYGVRIPHVAWQIQNEVRRAVEQMTGKIVKAVQVVVEGVIIPSAVKKGEVKEGVSP